MNKLIKSLIIDFSRLAIRFVFKSREILHKFTIKY